MKVRRWTTVFSRVSSGRQLRVSASRLISELCDSAGCYHLTWRYRRSAPWVCLSNVVKNLTAKTDRPRLGSSVCEMRNGLSARTLFYRPRLPTQDGFSPVWS
jgi:hypothetical protein